MIIPTAIPPRNSQPETHPDDERGRGREGRASIGWIDFPMPPKTHKESCREAASLLFDRQVALELRGRQIAERRVKALSVVDLLEELVDGLTVSLAACSFG